MDLLEEANFPGSPQPQFNLKKQLYKLLRRWPIVLVFFAVCMIIGYLINRYATPVYAVKARITTRKFNDKPSNPVPGLIDANFFLSGITEVYEEIPTLLAPKRIEATIDRLDFRVSYFARGIVKTYSESVKGFGFDVNIDSIEDGNYPHGIPIFVNHVADDKFKLNIENNEWAAETTDKIYDFNKPFKLGSATVHIINTNGRTAEQNKYFFVLNRKSDLVNQYRSKLRISWAMQGSSMLDLRIDSETPEKDLQFLNAYYQVVEEMGLRDKNETLDNTISFIDDQMKMVTDSIVFYQELIDNMKLDNRKLTLGSEFVYNGLNDIDKKRATVMMNERYLDYLTDYFRENRDGEVFAPSLIGLDIPLLEKWVSDFINGKLRGGNELNEYNALNPLVSRQDSTGRKLEKGIYEAINSERERNRVALAELDRSESSLYVSVPDMQTDFRELSTYQRMLQLNQTLFDLFLRRKTEAAISKASATSDYKIIESPSYSRTPIRPNEDQNLLIAGALGLLLPIGFFLIKDLTNEKIMDREDLVANTQIPVLGNVAHSNYETNQIIREHPRSVVAESFRAVRANLKYMAGNLPSTTFLVTSSVGGEGKTFCSLNLACTLSIAKKRTILIAADLRKPQQINYADRPKGGIGLSEYLAGLNEIEDVLVRGENELPDFIDAGNIPPNPSELLSNQRMTELVTYLKERYEYIIIDTPPIGLVADAMELFKYTDFNILIVRQGVTHKGALKMIDELYQEGKLKNFTVLLNDIALTKNRGSYYGGYLYGMGYSGYGYGYYNEDRKRRKI